ncbi:MAG TPA: baseplate J/gp47 family protein [Candidatus Dormibacteraeota bacterium]|nr:baseplate J/gp47 family protein [Candidatus Dormibacteraeota bacterium]
MKLLGAYVLGAPLAALVGIGFLGYGEHAVVRLVVAAQQVRVENVPLGGGASASGGLTTTQIEASASEQQTVTSAMVQLPATAAAGRVTFMCSPMTSCPNGYTVAAGTILESTDGAQYRTLSTVSFPSCAPSSAVGVSALSAGAAGNAGAGTVVYGQFPGYIHVDNALPIVGGADPHSVPVVQQSDLDAASTALMAKVSAELGAKLQAQAGGLSYLTTGAPALNVASDAHVGDSTPTFTVTVTGTIHAIAYSARAANALLRHALAQSSAAGYQVTSGPIKASYSLQANGEITGSASAYVVPRVDGTALATAVRGESPSQALSWIDRAVPGAAADIRISPIALPWLPMLSDHISVVVLIRSAG